MRIWKVLHSLQLVNFWGWVYYIVHTCTPLQANTWAAPKCQWNLDQILHRPELIVFLFFHGEGAVGFGGGWGWGWGVVLEQRHDQNVLFHFFYGERVVGLVFVCLFFVVVRGHTLMSWPKCFYGERGWGVGVIIWRGWGGGGRPYITMSWLECFHGEGVVCVCGGGGGGESYINNVMTRMLSWWRGCVCMCVCVWGGGGAGVSYINNVMTIMFSWWRGCVCMCVCVGGGGGGGDHTLTMSWPECFHGEGGGGGGGIIH